MADGSAIEWTEMTWNALIGCSRISPGCDNCYAIPTVARGEAMGTAQHVGLTIRKDDRVDWNGKVNVVEHLMDAPLRKARPRRIFVNSLSDLFHESVSDETIVRLLAIMGMAEQHQFQVLTKRSRRMRSVLNNPELPRLVRSVAEIEFHKLDAGTAGRVERHQRARATANSAWPWTIEWPIPNVWLGVSIESDKYTFRADHLRQTPAAIRWVSAEPLLGPLPSLDLTGIDWVVAGGESQTGARPMHPDWVRDLRDRCHDRLIPCPNDTDGDGNCAACWSGESSLCPKPGYHSAPVPFLFKQWGDWGPVSGAMVGRVHVWPDDPGDADSWMERVGKRAAGRSLDGRTWDEYPA